MFAALTRAHSSIYCGQQHPFLHYHGVIFLLFELSTPFMHLRWICIQTGNSKGVIFKLIEVRVTLALCALLQQQQH